MSPITQLLDSMVELGIIFLIVFTPLAFGAVYAWGYGTMILVTIVLVLLTVLKTAISRQPSALSGTQDAKHETLHAPRPSHITYHMSPITALTLPSLLLLCYVAFQMVPLPASLVRYISPNTHKVNEMVEDQRSAVSGQRSARGGGQREATDREAGQVTTNNVPQSGINNRAANNVSWISLSLSPYGTRIELLKLLAYVAIFFLIIMNVTRTAQVRRIVFAVLITGGIVAAVAILQVASNADKIYWFWEPLDKAAISGRRAGGPFVNENHFAGYMEMVIPIYLGLLLRRFADFRFSSLRSADWKKKVLRLNSLFSRSFLLLLAAAIGIYAFFLSLSRGGIISFLAAIALFANLFVWYQGERRRNATLLLAVGCILVILLTWLGMARVTERMSNLTDTARLAMFRDTLLMGINFPLFGVGFGNFQTVFPMFESKMLTKALIEHAHNDYLEAFSELGIVGMGLLAWAALAFAAVAARGVRSIAGWNPPPTATPAPAEEAEANGTVAETTHHRHHGSRRRHRSISWQRITDDRVIRIGVLLGGLTGIVAILFHSMTDFNLHIPANAFLFSVIAGLVVAVCRSREQN